MKTEPPAFSNRYCLTLVDRRCRRSGHCRCRPGGSALHPGKLRPMKFERRRNLMKLLNALSVAALTLLPLYSQIPSAHRSFQNVQGYQQILVLGIDGHLSLEHAPFGNGPHRRSVIDANVRAFQALDRRTVLVLGIDGNLSLEQAPFGILPPSRLQVDANVRAFQAVNANHIFVLGNDRKLWFEHGPLGSIPQSRQQVDADVQAFQATDTQNALVLGTDGQLWLERAPFGNVPSSRQQVDANVALR